MKNILFIGNYPPPFSGQSIAFKTLVDGYSNKNNNYYVINTIEKENKRGIIIRLIDYLNVLFKLLYFILFKNVETVYHIVSSSKIGFFRDYIIINIVNVFRKRIVIHSHNGNYDLFYKMSSKFHQGIIKKTINNADKIILLSSKLRYTFNFIEDDNKFIFIPNGLPISKTMSRLNKGSEISVLFLSNLIESKGYLDILESILLMQKDNSLSNFHFHFAGGFMLNAKQDKSFSTIKEAKELFFKKIEDNNLSKYVTYHGVVQGKEKESLLNTADVFLLPTYYLVEAQPITIIEALAYGCAIYSTNYRGISEMLKDGVNGEFVKACCPKDIVMKLKGLDRSKIEKYSKNSIKLFETNFTKEKHLNRIIKVIKG